jgi:hypothetical protein
MARVLPASARLAGHILFFKARISPSTLRSNNRNQGSHTDEACPLSLHTALGESPRTPCFGRIAETRRHRSTFATHLASTSILFCLPACRSHSYLEASLLGLVGLGDRSLSGGRLARGDKDMSLRFLSGWPRCGVVQGWEEAEGPAWEISWAQGQSRELFVTVNRYAIARPFC